MLCKNLSQAGCDVSLCTIADNEADNDRLSLGTLKVVRVKRSFSFRRFKYARGLKLILSELANDTLIIHSHGLWIQVSRDSAMIARDKHKPHIVSPRGMLEPWALNNSKLKKMIAGWVFQNRALREVACLHATAQQEAEAFRQFGLKNPIAVIPNGVDAEEYVCKTDRAIININWSQLKGKRLVLFMSRVHPKKGLINLAKVWASLAKKYSDWHLVIAGPDENGHEAEIRYEIEKAGVEDQVTFTGPAYGEDKKQLLAACDLFVLPTFSENFGIVIAEALASGKPVITTKGTPWQELETHQCGWWIDIGIDPLEAAIKNAMELSDIDRREMGLRGRKLIENNYSWPIVSKQMVSVYKWLLGREARPGCVELS